MATVTRAETQPSLWADEAEVAEAAKSWKPASQDCREFRHAWERYTASIAQDGSVERTLQCGRNCGTLRSETLHIIGERLVRVGSPRYSYEEGYLIPGLGRIGGEGLEVLRFIAMSREINLPRAKASRSKAAGKRAD